MCHQRFTTLKSLKEVQSFIVSLALPLPEQTALDISLLCLELAQNSLEHGGSRNVEIEGSQTHIVITDFGTKEFNPLISAPQSPKSQGLNFVRLFMGKHKDIELMHEYIESDQSNVFRIFLPEPPLVSTNYESCTITVSGQLFYRHNNELEEQMRLLTHCPEVLINIDYGNMASSFVIPTLEAILKISSSREQRITIRTTPGDLVKNTLLEQVERFALYHPKIREIVTIQ